MPSPLAALVPLLLGAVVPASADQPGPRPDAPDAVRPFLPAPARSLRQLVREVQRDATLRSRYAEFFHITDALVVSFLSARLLPKTLSRPGSYTVYYVSTAGTLYPTRMALESGTPVFVGRDGVPVLLRGAGNPVVPFSMVIEAPTLPPPPAPVPIVVQEQVVPAGTDIRVTAPDNPPSH